MMFKQQFMNLTDIGRLFGKTTREVGKRLQEIGLRTAKGKPSDAAYRRDLIEVKNPGTWGWTYVWHAQRTSQQLIERGWKPIVPPPIDLVIPITPIGPFTVQSSAGQFQILGADGEACVWMLDQITADKVCRVMNVGHRLGVFCPSVPVVPHKVDVVVDDPDFRPAFTIHEWTKK